MVLRKIVEHFNASAGSLRDAIAPRRREVREGTYPERCLNNSLKLSQALFSISPSTDFQLLGALVLSKRDAALSHLIQVRQSPPYLSMQIEAWSDHSGCNRDECGHRWQDPHAAAYHMIMDVYEQAWSWSVTLDTLKQLRLSGLAVLGVDPTMLFAQLRDHIRSTQDRVCNRLADALPSASTFKDELNFCAPTEGKLAETMYCYEPKAEASQVLCRLFQLFSRLTSDDDRYMIRPHNISEDISRLIQTKAEASNPMTDWLVARFDDVANILEVDRHMELWQPDGTHALALTSRARQENDKTAFITDDWSRKLYAYLKVHPLPHGYGELKCSLEDAETTGVYKQQRRSCDFVETWWKGFDAVIGWSIGSELDQDGRRGPDVFAKLMHAADKLDYPWKWATRKHTKQGKSGAAVIPADPGLRSDAGDAAKNLLNGNVTSQIQQDDARMVLNNNEINSLSAATGKLSLKNDMSLLPTGRRKRAGKKKAKLQKSLEFGKLPANRSPPTAFPPPAAASSQLRLDQILVKPDYHNTMLVLFGVERGQILFDDFTKAMASMGFEVRSQKGSGSGWLFMRKGWPPSTFHDWHGKQDRKIPREIALSMSSHLSRTYGWTVEIFVSSK